MKKVWFVDVVTSYGTACLHSVPVHIALEQCAEILNAEYIAVVDENCPPFKGTEKWLRVFHESHNLYAFAGRKDKLRGFCDLCARTRSLLKDINKNASHIIVYLDYATLKQIFAVWLSAASLGTTSKNTIVWIHFHGVMKWNHRRFLQYLFKFFPIKTWITVNNSEHVAANRKYGWVVDDIFPLPLNPALNAFTYDHQSTNKVNIYRERSDKLVCWLFINRSDQGLELLPRIIDHWSARNFPRKFIKCFVSETVSIKDNAEIELVRLPYLTQEDYHLHFNECEVVFVPYNTLAYSGKVSMVFIEAIVTSKIAIVSDGTTMASELRRFELGDLVMDFNNQFSWTFINEIRKDSRIRARLNLMADNYVKEYGTFGRAQSLYKYLKRIDSKMALSESKRA
jgi:hypothetical protein